jgi:hypothetical protein
MNLTFISTRKFMRVVFIAAYEENGNEKEWSEEFHDF